MSITATVFDANDAPISRDFVIRDDNFSVAEKAARKAAEDGMRCYIRWQRSTDGQIAYWGPRGACFAPHWYARPGRPSELAKGRKVNTYLDAESIEIADKLGKGNVSDGIRFALKRAAANL